MLFQKYCGLCSESVAWFVIVCVKNVCHCLGVLYLFTYLFINYWIVLAGNPFRGGNFEVLFQVIVVSRLSSKPCEWLLLQVVLGKIWGTVLNFRLQAGGLLNECSTDPCVR